MVEQQQPAAMVESQAVAIQPQYVMVPVARSNTLGVFGLIVAIIGIFIPTGVVAMLGLMMSLVAIGRAPRAAASFGVVIGLLASLVWLAIDFALVVVATVAIAGVGASAAVMFAMTQPETVELSADMANIVISARHYEQTKGRPAQRVDQLDLSRAMTLDPWGKPYELSWSPASGSIEIASAGPDGVLESRDDVRLSQLERVWEQSMLTLDRDVEKFGQKLASMGSGDSESIIEIGGTVVRIDRNGVIVNGHRVASVNQSGEGRQSLQRFFDTVADGNEEADGSPTSIAERYVRDAIEEIHGDDAAASTHGAAEGTRDDASEAAHDNSDAGGESQDHAIRASDDH